MLGAPHRAEESLESLALGFSKGRASMKTRITELFEIKHPVVLAGMGSITNPQIVSTVCNAGGLGIFAITGWTPEETRKAIREIKALTDKPFAINQLLVSPRARANINVVIEEKVPIVNYSLGRPWFIDQVHAYGGKVVGTVALVRHAVRAEQLGVDALISTGHEAAAHGAEATSLVLVPMITGKVKIPLIAAGGFYDGRGLAAALALGADAISMGTRFMVTKESILSEHWKQVILKATEQDTIYLDFGDPAVNARVLRTKKAEARRGGFPVISGLAGVLETKRMLKLSWWELIRSGISTSKNEEGMSLRQQIRYAASSARSHKVIVDGDENAGTLAAGQCIGGIEDIPTCQELIERIVAEAEKALDAARQKVHA